MINLLDGGEIMTEGLTRELKISGLQYLRQFDYPQMPKTFSGKVETRAGELTRLVHHKIISTTEAFSEIKNFVVSEFAKIYYQEY
jgi:hypothetical protein